MIITIDGPAATGKSSVTRVLAKKLDIHYLNSGLLF
ncbi:(d)CMP kinase, partial [Candidatus Dependentiae bacterium]|nr:(d)CMP kinase [Candidatus Dependentiae bacterium]